MEVFQRARELLERPKLYQGLVPRGNASIPLRVWRYPSFTPWSSWAVLEDKKQLFLRRIEWDLRRTHIPPLNTYGCEAPLEQAAFDALMPELQAVELSPFIPTPGIGIDGVWYGIEAGSYMGSARLVWREKPPKSWEPLGVWHARVTAFFDSLLPQSTANLG
jgi:hypothetical protein